MDETVDKDMILGTSWEREMRLAAGWAKRGGKGRNEMCILYSSSYF